MPNSFAAQRVLISFDDYDDDDEQRREDAEMQSTERQTKIAECDAICYCWLYACKIDSYNLCANTVIKKTLWFNQASRCNIVLLFGFGRGACFFFSRCGTILGMWCIICVCISPLLCRCVSLSVFGV